MKTGWIDSHVHLMDDSILLQIDDVIQRAKDNNVTKIMLIAMNQAEFELGLRLLEKYDILNLTAGFHPQDAHLVSSKDFQKLEELAKEGKIRAIGEIGLDYYWDKSYEKEQREVFRKQIELAIKYDLPISIHMREATQDTYDILSEYKGKIKGVMHCYSGSVEMAKAFIELGFYISFAGILTFSNARLNKEVAQSIPSDRILTETDGPYLAPTPFRGKMNEPAYVRYTGEMLAELREVDISTLQSQIKENYKRLFK